MIDIYTDGGASGNPGPGAWAFVILYPDGTLVEGAGGVPLTTNNRMELEAVIQALEFCARPENPKAPAGWKDAPLRVRTDSQYVQLGITQWIQGWIQRGWKTSSKKPVKNQDLWFRLWELVQPLRVEWEWVQGHAGDPYNERCDALVREQILKIKATG